MSTVPSHGDFRSPSSDSPSPPAAPPLARDAHRFDGPGSDPWPPPTIARDVLSRAIRRISGWIAPQRSAARYAGLAGSCDVAPVAIGYLPDGGARHAWLHLRDRTLALRLWGDPDSRPFVVLAMSSQATDASRLLPWIHALLETGHAVVSFDRTPPPGDRRHPPTIAEMASDLAAIGARFGGAEAVIGHSIGASATVLALAQGLRAERVVLLSAQADPREALDRFAKRIGIGTRVASLLAGQLEQRMGMPLEDLHPHRLAPAVSTPALVVHDLLDDQVPWADGECFARHLPFSRLLTTLDLGHQGVLDDPDVMRDCMRFLAGEAIGDTVVSSPNLPYGMA